MKRVTCWTCGAREYMTVNNRGDVVTDYVVECRCKPADVERRLGVVAPVKARYCQTEDCGVDITTRAANTRYCLACTSASSPKARGRRGPVVRAA